MSKNVTFSINVQIYDTQAKGSNETFHFTYYNNANTNIKEDTLLIYHSEPIDSILKELETNSETGLSHSDIPLLLAEYGDNKLKEKKKKTTWQRFLDQFKDVMILILIAAAIISFTIACVEGNPKEFFEPALILLIVIINAIMGVMQESKAEKALDALKNLSAPHARVIRDSMESVIDASQLVPGDVIRLEAGDFIPSDARLIRSVSLKSEESALTGESVPSEKDADTVVDENVIVSNLYKFVDVYSNEEYSDFNNNVYNVKFNQIDDNVKIIKTSTKENIGIEELENIIKEMLNKY